MMHIGEEVLDHLTNPYILADRAGKIVKMNEPIVSLFRKLGKPFPVQISDIDPAIFSSSPDDGGLQTMTIANRTMKLLAIPAQIAPREKGWLYLFDTPEILRKIDFDTFLDYIDDAIVVSNAEGFVEHFNDAALEMTRLGIRGLSFHELVRRGDIEESSTLRVLKTKKTEKINVRYHTGKTLTFTGIPLFGVDGSVNHVINTGRDVTKLVQMQEDLQKAEALKKRYLSRLSTLESLVGSNTIVHSSDDMKRVVSFAIKAAKSDSPVFIWGESGVGKELIADLIHKSSQRSKYPFIAINCSAIPSELLEAEFFGYEEGAFTGAKKGGKKGLFEEAGSGTLFLDEITELPFPMQSKLLRALQEREFMRVGGTRVIPLQARIISSSNLTKMELADPARFRRDLFYRLNVVPLFIPPLRNRREDIFPLVRFFLKNMNVKYNSDIRISPNLMTRFYNYQWPGNVRELKNMIERLIIMADKDEVDIEDYQAIGQLEEKDDAVGAGGISIANLMPMKTAIEKVEELLIMKALKESGTVLKASRILQIAPSTIYRKAEKGLISLDE